MDSSKKLPLWQIVLMTIATEFGFANIIIVYFQMGYASIIWYLLSALTFFLPLVIIVAEYSGAIKNDHGGFYSWLVDSIGEKWAFIGTFMWLCDFVINVLQISSGQGVGISEVLFGTDTTAKWHLGPIDSTGTLSILGIALLLIATYVACRGVHHVALASTIGGIMSMLIVGIFASISILLIFVNHGHLAQPVQGISTFIKSPNPGFQTPMAILSFIVYAMFSYSGIESVSGFIDKLKNPRKTFPKAMIYSAIIMTIIYIGGIILCGASLNWKQVFGGKGMNVVNCIFVLMENLGVYLAHSMGWSIATGKLIGVSLVRFAAIGEFLTSIGTLIVFSYSPIKSLIAGSSKDLWPKKITKFNKHDMPSRAMWYQFGIITVALAFIALTGKNGANFFQIIMDMSNISAIFPYFFLAVAFVLFKRYSHNQPIVFLHTKGSVYLTIGIFVLTMIFGLFTNLASPIMQGQYATAVWSFVGPVLFFVLAFALYYFGIRHRAKRMIADNINYEKNK